MTPIYNSPTSAISQVKVLSIKVKQTDLREPSLKLHMLSMNWSNGNGLYQAEETNESKKEGSVK